MKKIKTYKKKVIITDEKTTAQARAVRLKMVRNMANLSRKEMCANGININTYKGWEIGRYGGLTLDGAKQVIERIAKEGVICSFEWLIYEIGRGACVSADFKKIQKEQQNNKEKISPDDTKGKTQEKLIFNEILLFRQQFSATIDYQILDDGLSPKFTIGDFVAGIKHYDKAINTLLNQDCIVRLANGETMVRHLRKSNDQNTYMLVCTNPNTAVASPVLYDVKISSAAPILRHYKKYE